MDFVLGLQKHFLLPALTAADGLVDQAGRLQLSGADLPFRDLLAVADAQDKAQTNAHQNANDDQKNLIPFHKYAAHLLLI